MSNPEVCVFMGRRHKQILATNLDQHPTIVEENLDAEEKKSSSDASSLLHTEHDTSKSLELTNTKKKLKLKKQKTKTRNIESISSHNSSEEDDESGGIGNASESSDQDDGLIVLGGGELCRETVALYDEADDLPNLMNQIDIKAKRRLKAYAQNDRKAFEESPGHFLGIEHYTNSDYQKQRGILDIDIREIGKKIDYVGKTRISKGNRSMRSTNRQGKSSYRSKIGSSEKNFYQEERVRQQK